MVTSILAASAKFDTAPVAAGYRVFCHTDLEPDIRDLPGFTPIERYASGKPEPNEVGAVERFRFLTSPDLPSIQDAGAPVGATGLYSTSGTNIDVYPIVVTGQDAWSQIAVRGLEALNPTFLPPGQKTKSDPFGQRGYVGATWWKACLLENNGWMAVAYVGRKNL
jgi:N4-gp56 family major capsid protein